LLESVLGPSLKFIGIEVEDEVQAFSLFETLNARGVQLGPADLIKNFLFSSLRAEEDLAVADHRWAQICDAVGPEHVAELIRYYFCRSHAVIRNEQLLRLTKEAAGTPERALEFLTRMEREAEDLSALRNDRDPAWNHDAELVEGIRVLNLFGVKQSYPLLLAAKQRFDAGDFKKTLRLIIAFSFRYTVIGRFSPSDLEPVLNGAAIAIEKGEIRRPRAAYQAIKQKYIDDSRFESLFANASFDYTNRRRKIVRYILGEIEYQSGGMRIDFESSDATVEHVLPQNPSGDWHELFGKNFDAFVNRLGNLSLLERELNDKARGLPFAQKAQIYGLSKFEMSRALKSGEEWSPGIVDARQNSWAKLACQIWKVHFDD
jgi:hypothetical protein